MSRVGKSPITVPNGVSITVKDGLVTAKGPKGEVSQAMNPDITIEIENGVLTVNRPSDSKQHRALHGLYRALINNMVVGVSTGHQVKQELVGVGYKVSNQGNLLEFTLGFSHRIMLEVPKEIKVATETLKGQNPSITMECADKQLLGQIAAKIRSFRKPEPYKGKGIRFSGEILRKKAGKSASK
ncbi:MAG: 50S ribosomal protein L6 [Bacteroidetes bacterium]|nr:50S ribosomal protein L6 [Bacteroidota bacterium]